MTNVNLKVVACVAAGYSFVIFSLAKQVKRYRVNSKCSFYILMFQLRIHKLDSKKLSMHVEKEHPWRNQVHQGDGRDISGSQINSVFHSENNR